MSLFYCNACDNYRDADDGCEELRGELICADCADAARADEEEAETFRLANPFEPGFRRLG